MTKRLENIREAERRQARGLLQSLGLRLSADQLQTVEQIKEEERERRREDVVRGLETIGKEVERAHWHEIAGEHNERVRKLGVEHVRAVRARLQGRAGLERDCALEQAGRQVERLMITPERTAGLDLEKFRAVRDGREAGYRSAGKTHAYERLDKPALEVGHDAPERRLAEMVRDVDQGGRWNTY